MKFSLPAWLLLISTFAFAADDFAAAVAAFEHGDVASAETILHGLLRSRPNDPAALGLLGAVLDTEKKYGEAESTYKRALQFAPKSATLLNNFANHQAATGDLAGAACHLSEGNRAGSVARQRQPAARVACRSGEKRR